MQLENIIIEKIQKDGPVSFRDFMEIALYYPDLGYYTSSAEKIGKEGDYYTSPYLTNLFGEMIGKQLEEMWYLLGEKDFTIVEYGAGPGALCLDILGYLKNNKPLYEALNYYIIEKSSAMRAKEQQLLKEKVKWVNAITEIPPVTGCILANEVVDNFSVHAVMMEDELMELFVNYDNGFLELWQQASPAVKKYLKELNVDLPKGYRAEINLQAIDWIKEVATALNAGFVLTIDYGATSADLYSAARKSGTLLCYHKHSINDNIFDNIGQQDITAHVNFSALHHWGLQYGLEPAGFTSQAHFLLSWAFLLT